MWQKLLHKTLKIPYRLHYEQFRRPVKYRATIILLHGLGSSTGMWRSVVRKLPPDVRVIGIDLLGFGRSKKPSWNTYDVRTQADSIATTLFGMRISGPIVMAGHSLGALVAIEFARRYRFMTRALVLASPPLYNLDRQLKRLEHKPDEIVRRVFTLMSQRPHDTDYVLRLASKYRLINNGFVAENINVPAYLATLETAIINQSSFHDIQRIKRPIHIVSGTLDIFTLDTTLRQLATLPNITWQRVLGGHEVTGRVQTAIVRAITNAVDQQTPHRANLPDNEML